jgi:hypothetical protein
MLRNKIQETSEISPLKWLTQIKFNIGEDIDNLYWSTFILGYVSLSLSYFITPFKLKKTDINANNYYPLEMHIIFSRNTIDDSLWID